MNIRLLEREEIVDKLWNGCVHFAVNNMPYGYTWHLDNMAPHWQGLVMDDYQAVFPLVHNKKLGFSYLYQPLFTQQLGIFSMRPVNNAMLQAFLKQVPDTYKLIEINLNYMNEVQQNGYSIQQRPNLELDLQKPYEELRKGYSSNTKRNLKKADKAGLHITNNLKPEKLIDFYREHTAGKVKEFTEWHYHALHRLVYISRHWSMSTTFAVYHEKELVSASFFLHGKSRMINLLPATSDKGRELRANFQLIDYLVRANAERRFVLDFEGSSIPGVARFYKGFGAEEVPYWHLRRNTLPWYIRWYKR